jgi:hypothetical protein
MKEVIDLLENADIFLTDINGDVAEITPRNFVKAAAVSIRKAISKLQAPPRYETPEQYKKRTGKEWPRNWAVYCGKKYETEDYRIYEWDVHSYSDILEIIKHTHSYEVCDVIIVATELGCPPDGWTPEEDA